MICEKCGYEERDGAFFCRNCGKLLDPAGYSSKSVYETEEHRIMRMVENLKHHPHYDILWDDTMDLYAAKVEKFQSILGTGVLDIDQGSLDDLKDKFKVFLKECRHPEFQIAFVGTIKTGKSTLINALLGHNYSSTAVTPETAALAKFRSSEKDYINVTFFSPEEWEKLWNSRTKGADSFTNEYDSLGAEKEKNKWVGHDMIHCELANEAIEQELNKWSSSKSPQHFFVKEIEVGLSSLPKDLPKQVVFVDTPGLSDPVAYRSEISRQYIQQANAVFVCVEAQKVNKEELETISAVLSFSAHDKRKVFVIATHWDTMNDPVEDWAKQRAYLVKKLIGSAFYDSAEMADANILHSSAFIHNLCRDYNTLNKASLKSLRRFAMAMDLDPYNLTKRDIEKLDYYSNIHQIRALIRDRLLKNCSELFYGDLKQRYDKLLHLLHRNATDLRASYQEQIDATGKNLAGILQDFDQKKKDADEIRKGRDHLKAALDAVKRKTNRRVNEYQKLIKNLNEK